MNYAFMTFSCPTATFQDALDLARRYGYAGIEPRSGSGQAHGIEIEATPEQRERFRSQAEQAGVDLCCLATSCRFADPATAGDFVKQGHSYIDLAGDVGSPRLRVFGGPLGKGVSREAAIAGVSACLTELADHAAERGVTLCMETHDDWCDPDHVGAVMRAVDHPAVAVNWDIMHPVRTAGWSMDRAFVALRPWIRHVHVHDGVGDAEGKLKFVAIGEGEVDHAAALKLLCSMEYDGYLSGEWIGWQPAEEHLPRELATLQALEAKL